MRTSLFVSRLSPPRIDVLGFVQLTQASAVLLEPDCICTISLHHSSARSSTHEHCAFDAQLMSVSITHVRPLSLRSRQASWIVDF